jgi:glutathione synthase/RimK-type ligase-like ATP-grasp enzyme/ribosomal protein S18 acetylase RimI-like enzyme
MKQIKYRVARPDDLAALCVIEWQSFTSDRMSKAAIRRSITSSTQWSLVAVSSDDIPVGHVLMHIRKNSRYPRIYSLAVLDAWRGRGIAKQLLRHAADAARAQARSGLTLEARRDDKSLVEFYLSQGFSPREIRPAYYEDGADAIRMMMHFINQKATGTGQRPYRTVVVVPRTQDLQLLGPVREKRTSCGIMTARDYLLHAPDQGKGTQVINLCPGDEYLSSGYYVSLVAEARGSTAQPSIDTLSNLETKRLYEDHLSELNQLLPKTPVLSEMHDPSKTESFSLEFYFGHTDQLWARRLAKRCFQLFQVPVLEIMIVWHLNRWTVDYVWPLSIAAIDPPDQARFMRELMDAIGPAIKTVSPRKRPYFDLAILVDPDEALPPSNQRALHLMARAAGRHDMVTEIITRTDLKRLEAFDGLFIRATTNIDHFTYRFAVKAAQLGIPVIDDPKSILRCSNKVFLFEALARAGVAMPQTALLTRGNISSVTASLEYPQVLKIPDGSFSRGVIKVKSADELRDRAREMLENSYVILAQEYLPTEYDWRIGVLNGQPLYAAKYFMARGHWQIYHHKQNKKVVSGGFETMPIDAVPPYILQAAVTAGLTIGDGLYGVDLKDINRRAVVIEVNDNPNIDAGIEDHVAGAQLYESLMTRFRDLIRQSKGILER